MMTVFFRHNIKIAKSNLKMLAWHKDVPLIVSDDGFIMQQVWNYWILNIGMVTKTSNESNEILTLFRGVISVLRSPLCALLLGCIDNGPKMAKIKIELCYFTYVFRGIIQGIEWKNEPPNLKFTPGTFQKTEMAISAVFWLSPRIPTFS